MARAPCKRHQKQSHQSSVLRIFDSEGREFESLRARQFLLLLQAVTPASSSTFTWFHWNRVGLHLFLKHAALRRMGLLDYLSAIFGKMLSYHAVGEFLLGGSHRGYRLAQVYFLLCRLPLASWQPAEGAKSISTENVCEKRDDGVGNVKASCLREKFSGSGQGFEAPAADSETMR
jgi:hypothetical protein